MCSLHNTAWRRLPDVSQPRLAFLDQVVWSGSNLLLTLLVALLLGPTKFGEFTLLIAGYLMVWSLSQAVVSEPLLVKRWEVPAPSFAGSLGAAAGVGIAASALGVPLALAVGSGPLLLMAALFPLLMLQEGARAVAVACDRSWVALVGDSGWFTLQAVSSIVIAARGQAEVMNLLAAWAVPGALCGVAMLLALNVRPQLALALPWLRTTANLGRPLTWNAVVTMGTSQAVLLLAGLLGQPSTAGTLRLAQTLYGPTNVISGATRFSGLAHMSRVDSLRQGVRPAVRVGTTVSILTLAWTVALVVAIAVVPGRPWGGAGFTGLFLVVLLVGVQKVIEGFAFGADLGLRARQLPRPVMRVRTLAAVLTLLGVAALAVNDARSVALAAWLLVTSVVTVMSMWKALRHAVHDSSLPHAVRQLHTRPAIARSVAKQVVVNSKLGAAVYVHRYGFQGRPGKDTDVLLEGFPRSANTYVKEYLKTTNPRLVLASHLHGTGSLAWAERYGTPSMLLIRDPVDVAASLLVRDGIDPAAALSCYAMYYRSCFSYPHAFPVFFDDVVAALPEVVEVFSARHGLALAAPPVDAQLRDRLKVAVLESERRFAGSLVLAKVSWPLAERQPLLDEARQRVLAAHASRLREASILFDEWRAAASAARAAVSG